MFGSIFNLNILVTILSAILVGSLYQKSQKIVTMVPPFKIDLQQKPLKKTIMGFFQANWDLVILCLAKPSKTKWKFSLGVEINLGTFHVTTRDIRFSLVLCQCPLSQTKNMILSKNTPTVS